MGTGWWAQHSLSYIQFVWVSSSDLAPGDIVNGSIGVDNVIEFDMVTSAGEHLTANSHSHICSGPSWGQQDIWHCNFCDISHSSFCSTDGGLPGSECNQQRNFQNPLYRICSDAPCPVGCWFCWICNGHKQQHPDGLHRGEYDAGAGQQHNRSPICIRQQPHFSGSQCFHRNHSALPLLLRMVHCIFLYGNGGRI